MTGKPAEKFHGVGIGPLSEIVAVKYLSLITWYQSTNDNYIASANHW